MISNSQRANRDYSQRFPVSTPREYIDLIDAADGMSDALFYMPSWTDVNTATYIDLATTEYLTPPVFSKPRLTKMFDVGVPHFELNIEFYYFF